jgi:hypothetical protein
MERTATVIDAYRYNAPLRIKPCYMCQKETGEFRRQHTAYVNEASNWSFLCDPCQKEADEYWDDMWTEYYHSVMY